MRAGVQRLRLKEVLASQGAMPPPLPAAAAEDSVAQEGWLLDDWEDLCGDDPHAAANQSASSSAHTG